MVILDRLVGTTMWQILVHEICVFCDRDETAIHEGGQRKDISRSWISDLLKDRTSMGRSVMCYCVDDCEAVELFQLQIRYLWRRAMRHGRSEIYSNSDLIQSIQMKDLKLWAGIKGSAVSTRMCFMVEDKPRYLPYSTRRRIDSDCSVPMSG